MVHSLRISTSSVADTCPSIPSVVRHSVSITAARALVARVACAARAGRVAESQDDDDFPDGPPDRVAVGIAGTDLHGEGCSSMRVVLVDHGLDDRASATGSGVVGTG